jgi:PAS domain S-box-containing protein
LNSEGRATALIVEPDEETASRLKSILGARFSMEVEYACDSSQARQKLASTDFDIVTLDFRLAGDEDPRLLKEITSSEDHPPVILILDEGSERAARSLEADASGYVIQDTRMVSAFSDAVEKGLAEASLRHARKALSDEQSFIESALNSLPDTFFMLHFDGTGISWNKRLSEVTGYSNEEISSMTPEDFFRGEDLETVMDLLSKAGSGEMSSGRAEVDLFTKDGRAIPYEYTAALLKDGTGKPIGICGVGRDISERKATNVELERYREHLEELVRERTMLLKDSHERLLQEVSVRQNAEDELRKSESYYRSIVEYSHDVVGVFDAQGNMLFAGPTITRILGYDQRDITGRNLFDFVHPDDQPTLLENHGAVVDEQGLERTTECRFRDKGGGWRVLETIGRSFTDDSGEVRIVVNARDITNRKLAESAIFQSEEIASALLNAPTDAVVLLDAEGVILDINEKGTDVLGMARDDLVGLCLYDLVPAHLAQPSRSVADRVMSSRKPMRFKEQLCDRTFDYTAYPVFSEGDIRRFVLVARDITSRTRIERELRKSQETATAFINAILDTAILMSVEGTVLATNEIGARRVGKSAEELVGSNIYDWLPEDVAASRRVRVGEVVRARAPLRWEDERAGRYMDNSLCPILDDRGNVESVAIFARDITERKKAEEEIRQGYHNLMAFLNATTDYAILIGANGTVLAANTMLAESLGTSPEKLVGLNIYGPSPLETDIKERRVAHVDEVLARGEPIRFEDEHGGVCFEHRLYPVFDAAGKVERVAFFSRDITEQKRAEEEIKKSRENLQAFLDATTDYAALFGADGKIIAVNKTLAERLGVGTEELIGFEMHGNAPLETEIKDNRVSRLEEVLKSGKPVRFEDERGGIHFEHRLYPVFDAAGKVERVAFFSRDITVQKKTEAARSQSERQFRELVELSPLAMAVYAGANEEIQLVNRKFTELFGYTIEEIPTVDDWWPLVYPDENYREAIRVEWASRVERAVEKHGEIEPMETTITCKDGSLREIEFYLSSIGERNLVTFVDVTERMLMEQALRDSEERYRLHFEHSSDVIYSLDTEFRVVSVSPSVERALGYKPEELVGKKISELDVLDDKSLTLATSDALRALRGNPVSSEYVFITKDGRHVFGEVSGAPVIKDGKAVGVISVGRDMTERKLAQEKLMQSEERYRSFYSVSPDYIFITDLDGRVVDANQALLERLDLSLDEIQDADYMAFADEDDIEKIRAAAGRLSHGEVVKRLEVKAVMDNETYDFEINAAPLYENGKITKYVGLARDITERKRSEEELKRLNRELDGYAQTVSHDLRTPLSAIKLANETLLKVWSRRDRLDLDLDAEIRRFCEVIELGTVQADSMISDLLTLARAGQEPVEVSEVSVSNVVRRILAERHALIQQRRVQLEVDEDLGRVWGSETHVYQLFSNIIDNAIKHNEEPGPSVKIARLDEMGTGGHRYVIKDNGPGIPPEDLENIFLPFFRGDKGETGIGLAIVEKIVKLYGGYVRAYNDGGATFEFYIQDLTEPLSDAS